MRISIRILALWLGLLLVSVASAWGATKITDLSEDTSPATDDYVMTIDVSDMTMSTDGTNKKVTLENLLGGTLSGLRSMADPGANRLIYWNSSTAALAPYTPSDAWRFVYFGASSALTELTLGAQYTILQSGGAAAAPTWTATVNFDPLVTPYGANPTTDAAGEIAVDTSAAPGSMFRFYGDAAYALPAYQAVSSTIKTPVAADDYPLWKFPYAITIRAIKVYVIGGTNVIGGLDECTGTLGVCTGLSPVDADITGLPDEEVADDGNLSNGGISANRYIQWHTTSTLGGPTSVTITMYYTVDQVN